MKERNIIAPTIFIVFLVFLTNFGTFTIATQFDWPLLIVSLLLSTIGICIDINLYKISSNKFEVKKEKNKLYDIIEKKKDRLEDVIRKIKESRDEEILIDISMYCYDILDTNDYLEYIRNAIHSNTLIDELKRNKIKHKKLSIIKKLLKYYNYTNDLDEVIMKYKNKSLITDEKTNLGASITTVICAIITVLGFFKFDYNSINISANLFVIFIVFTINIVSSIESYHKTKKYKVKYYKELQDIFEYEKFPKYKFRY